MRSMVLTVAAIALYPAAAVRAEEPLNSGVIAGTVAGDAAVTTVAAVDRGKNRRYVGAWNAQGRSFTIDNLPLGGTYDVVLDFEDGARLEGVNLRVPPSDYVEEQPITSEDAEALRGQMRDLNKFEDQIEVLAVEGNVQHAAVLVNKLRTRPFVNSQPGEVVWRCEVWHFERPDDTWIKVQDELFVVLYRERLQRSAYDAKSIAFDADLGGLTPTDEQPRVELGEIDPPGAEPGITIRGEKAEPAANGRSNAPSRRSET